MSDGSSTVLSLDEEQKSGVTEEVTVPSGGRSTRRSTAILGDAVRSDLEMEQIIASLGVEELTDPNYLAINNVAKIPGHDIGHAWLDTNSLLIPKQFGIIARDFQTRRPAQCVTYYYLQKRQGVDFRKAVMQYGAGRRRRNGRNAKQRGNALLADIRRHDDEVSRGSSTVTPNGTSATSRRAAIQPDATPASSGTTPDPDPEPPRRRRKPAASRLIIDKADSDAISSFRLKKAKADLSKGAGSREQFPNEIILTPSEEPLTPLVVEPTY
ncbi:hypothetical protein EDC04DRAFT_2990107 [Pisolithus marmoratus]|nr:hypothetical protein EDC04DRAFT_2990107 [Pisolithus marmoratus]